MEYNTEQKKAIVGLLRKNSDRQFTVGQIAQALAGGVGVSTVYRRMPELVKSGAVMRFDAPDGSHKSVYQAVVCEHCDAHLHMKCRDCGRLLHLDDAVSERVIEMIKRNSAFSVDGEETVLYGICEGCRK